MSMVHAEEHRNPTVGRRAHDSRRSVPAGTARSVVEDHLDELERLVDTAGGAVVERLIQERPSPDPATLVGSGFVNKMAAFAAEHEAPSVVFDEDLTASQIRNLEREMPEETKVLDRAAVILDIFAARARSREAKTQVELAQLNYLLPTSDPAVEPPVSPDRRHRHPRRRRDPARDRPPAGVEADRPAQGQARHHRA